MYKQASESKLRFQTPKGALSVEQLWELSQTDISNSIKAVKKVLKKNDDDDLSFLEESKTVDVENQLRFDILKDIFLTKKKETDDLRNAAEIKAYNQRIIMRMDANNEKDLDKLSNDELEKLLKK